MTSSITINKSASMDFHMRVTWSFVAGLFILRIPLRLFIPNADWAGPIFEIGPYFAIGCCEQKIFTWLHTQGQTLFR